MSFSFFDEQPELVQVGGSGSITVAILLCTFQGERYLAEQLESIIDQTHENWIIYASDDGSTDQTLSILRRYQNQLGEGRLVIFSGPGRGYALNFISLVKKDEIDADLYAFCDQDDIWSVEKLDVAVRWTMSNSSKELTLYCGRTSLVNERGEQIGFSPLFKRLPSFKNALVQSIAGGNTMVFNRLVKYILGAVPTEMEIISHDWWVYMVVTACGGKVRYDNAPYVNYRQHENNLIGSNSNFFSRVLHFKNMLDGRLIFWNDSHLAAIQSIKTFMSHENLKILTDFERARRSSLFKRLVLFRSSGVYRQTVQGNMALLVAVLFGKI